MISLIHSRAVQLDDEYLRLMFKPSLSEAERLILKAMIAEKERQAANV